MEIVNVPNSEFPSWLERRIRENEQLHLELIVLKVEVFKRGQTCLADLTGNPEDAKHLLTIDQAWAAIDECLRLGRQRNHDAKRLEMEVNRLGQLVHRQQQLIEWLEARWKATAEHLIISHAEQTKLLEKFVTDVLKEMSKGDTA